MKWDSVSLLFTWITQGQNQNLRICDSPCRHPAPAFSGLLRWDPTRSPNKPAVFLGHTLPPPSGSLCLPWKEKQPSIFLKAGCSDEGVKHMFSEMFSSSKRWSVYLKKSCVPVVFKTDNRQRPTVQSREPCSIPCNNLNGEGIWKRIDTRVCVYTLSCVPLCNPMDCTPPGSSDHGIFQARILEGVPLPSSGDLSDPGIFLMQGSNLHLLHWQVGSLPLSHFGSRHMYTHNWITLLYTWN